jgi:hypothetical protein
MVLLLSSKQVTENPTTLRELPRVASEFQAIVDPTTQVLATDCSAVRKGVVREPAI